MNPTKSENVRRKKGTTKNVNIDKNTSQNSVYILWNIITETSHGCQGLTNNLQIGYLLNCLYGLRNNKKDKKAPRIIDPMRGLPSQPLLRYVKLRVGVAHAPRIPGTFFPPSRAGKTSQNIPSACTTRNFVYLIRGPWAINVESGSMSCRRHDILHIHGL